MKELDELIASIIRLSERFAGARKIKLSTLCRYAVVPQRFFERLERGQGTLHALQKVYHYLDANWPEGLDWAEDIERNQH